MIDSVISLDLGIVAGKGACGESAPLFFGEQIIQQSGRVSELAKWREVGTGMGMAKSVGLLWNVLGRRRTGDWTVCSRECESTKHSSRNPILIYFEINQAPGGLVCLTHPFFESLERAGFLGLNADGVWGVGVEFEENSL